MFSIINEYLFFTNYFLIPIGVLQVFSAFNLIDNQRLIPVFFRNRKNLYKIFSVLCLIGFSYQTIEVFYLIPQSNKWTLEKKETLINYCISKGDKLDSNKIKLQSLVCKCYIEKIATLTSYDIFLEEGAKGKYFIEQKYSDKLNQCIEELRK